MDLALALKERYPYGTHPPHFKFDFLAVESGTWLRIYLGTDRLFFLRERKPIIQLVESFGLVPSFDISWVWETKYCDEYNVHVRQPTPQYELFVTRGTSKIGQKLLSHLSDTTDPLYDFVINDLMTAISLQRKSPIAVEHGCRNQFGFIFSFGTKKTAREFAANNPIDRVTSWFNIEDSCLYKYACQVYMKDKEPEEVVTIEQLFGKTPKRVRITKRPVHKVLDPAELYAKVQSGELSLEEFTKLIKAP